MYCTILSSYHHHSRNSNFPRCCKATVTIRSGDGRQGAGPFLALKQALHRFTSCTATTHRAWNSAIVACERAGSRSHALDLLKQHRPSLGVSNVGVCHPVNRRWEVLDVDRVTVIERRFYVWHSRVMVHVHTVFSNSPSSSMRPWQAMKVLRSTPSWTDFAPFRSGQTANASESPSKAGGLSSCGSWSRIRKLAVG